MLRNLRMFWKFMLLTAMIPLAVVIVSGAAVTGVGTLKTEYDRLYNSTLIPIMSLDGANLQLQALTANMNELNHSDTSQYKRTQLTKAVQEGDAALVAAIAQYEKEWASTTNPAVTAILQRAGKQDLQAAETQALTRFHQSYNGYLTYRDAVLAGRQIDTSVLYDGQLKPMQDNIAALVKFNQDLAQITSENAQRTISSTIIELVGAGALVTLIAVALAWLVARSITRPLALVTGAVQNLARGDLNRQMDERARQSVVTRGDEIGTFGKGLAGTELYLQEMAGLAASIADGDLTISVAPKSEADELGQSFLKMVANLRQLIGRVNESAQQVEGASQELADASEQAGLATTQVSATIQQVAQGAASQANSTSEMTVSIGEIKHRVGVITDGAANQSEAVQRASQSVVQLGETLGEVTDAAGTSVSTAQQVTRVAQDGAQTVQRAIQGIQAIHDSSSRVNVQVREMGQRSAEIGKIVSTIQDIADQTNLLALNAAIEAARAGDQGRGFAVVADEVRKLAEKSASASREIADLVRTVQKGTENAIRVAAEGEAYVTQGVQSATEAGQALEQILVASERNNQAVAAIQASAGHIQKLATQVADHLRTVADIGDQNLDAAREMNTGIGEVAHAVDSVAATAEENSASVEEVSATAEELSAQVEEVSAAAQELSAQADQLRGAVDAFKLQAAGPEDGPDNQQAQPPLSLPEPKAATAGAQLVGSAVVSGNGHWLPERLR